MFMYNLECKYGTHEAVTLLFTTSLIYDKLQNYFTFL